MSTVARRWLFVSSTAMSDVAELLGWLRRVVDRADTVVMRRADVGVEAAAARIVAESIRAEVEYTSDPVAAVDGVDGVAVGVRELDEVPVAVLRAAEKAGLHGPVKVQGPYPFATDAGSRASQHAATGVSRRADQRAAEDARDRSLAARQEARRAAIPRQGTRTPGSARQRAWDAHVARQEVA